MSEIASDFEFSRPERPVFDVFALVTTFGTFGSFGLSFGFPLDLFTLAFALTLDHDLLCLPLPDDCLLVLLRALQFR